MAPQGLGAFFKPLGTKTSAHGSAAPAKPAAPAKGLAMAVASPPPTPAATKGNAAETSQQLVTPPSVDPRKREIGTTEDRELQVPEPKKLRMDDGQAAVAPPTQASVPNNSVHQEIPSDLQATLQKAQKGTGSLPLFTAECFHHHASGHRYSWPTWISPEGLRDAKGLRPQEPGYNQGTLTIPDEKEQKDQGHGTPMLLQYWKLKAMHFDKIAFFKVGKFYELFYYDAFIAERECGLSWMTHDKRPHVGFPEVAKHNYAKKLIDAGYKVVVVEQVERVVEQKQRDKSDGPKCVERDACEVFTQGTLVDPELLGSAGAKYMSYLHFEETCGVMSFSVCLVDCATSQMKVGRMTDSSDRNALRTFLAQVQPAEVAYSVSNLPAEVLTLLRRLPCRPQLSPSHGSLDLLLAREELRKYRVTYPGKLDEEVEGVLKEDGPAVATAGAFACLRGALLGNRILPFATWGLLDSVCSSSQATAPGPNVSKRMVLDATALSALEVFETLEGTYKGSLLEFLDNTSTGSGFRLLKQWVCAPLYDAGEIRKRQETVEFFIAHQDLAQHLQSTLKQTPMDLDRITARVWSYALQAERHAVMYDDLTARRLGEFKTLLNSYRQCIGFINKAFSAGHTLPARLAQIVRSPAQGGVFPDLVGVIDQLSGAVVEGTDPKNGKPKCHPQVGADEQYDNISKKIGGIKQQLEAELQGLRKKSPSVSFTFTHRLPGFRYEVEVDDKALPQAFFNSVDVTSRPRGKVRFHTDAIKKMIAELDALEDKQGDCIFPFLARLFQKFHGYQAQFRAVLRCLAELDALLSLSASSQKLVGGSCCPEIVVPDSAEAPGILALKECRHPVAASIMGNGFVPNDTVMNADGVPGVLVVTGPNMGGKSTVLRQTCIAVLMAQLGCRVNSVACRLTPVDRIFTRIGSYDTILEGKSTLLVELEETAAVMAHGSHRSLAVLDELGRGTSTFDGAAIASAVLDELANRIGCLVMFATHYHPVSRAAAQSPKVAPFYMAANVDGNNSMTFLYRFLPGLCPASYGHNVARLAGLPASILQEALERSAEFERGQGADADELQRLAAAGDEPGLRALFKRLHPVMAA